MKKIIFEESPSVGPVQDGMVEAVLNMMFIKKILDGYELVFIRNSSMPRGAEDVYLKKDREFRYLCRVKDVPDEVTAVKTVRKLGNSVGIAIANEARILGIRPGDNIRVTIRKLEGEEEVDMVVRNDSAPAEDPWPHLSFERNLELTNILCDLDYFFHFAYESGSMPFTYQRFADIFIPEKDGTEPADVQAERMWNDLISLKVIVHGNDGTELDTDRCRELMFSHGCYPLGRSDFEDLGNRADMYNVCRINRIVINAVREGGRPLISMEDLRNRVRQEIPDEGELDAVLDRLIMQGRIDSPSTGYFGIA